MALLKDTGAFPGRPWGEAVTAWTKYAVALECRRRRRCALRPARGRCRTQGNATLLRRATAHHARAGAVWARGTSRGLSAAPFLPSMMHRLPRIILPAIVALCCTRPRERARKERGVRSHRFQRPTRSSDARVAWSARAMARTGRALVDSLLRAARRGHAGVRRRAVLARRARGDGGRRGARLSPRDRRVSAVALRRRCTAVARRAGTGTRRSRGGVPASAAVRARASGEPRACARRPRGGATRVRAARQRRAAAR